VGLDGTTPHTAMRLRRLWRVVAPRGGGQPVQGLQDSKSIAGRSKGWEFAATVRDRVSGLLDRAHGPRKGRR